MKKILLTAVILGMAGGVYADSFNELAVKASDLKKMDASVSAPLPAQPAEADKNNAGTVRFVMFISGACGGQLQVGPTWCPEPGDGVVGGIYKEIRVHLGDRVEITLHNDVQWTPGQVSFVLTSADSIEACDQPGNCPDFPLFGVGLLLGPGQSTVVSFTASKAGDFKYYDGINRSGYGRLVVEP